MQTLICRTCGCSLVRLGISTDQAATYHYNSEAYRFCCQGCVDVFMTDPHTHLQETHDLIVCPTCLAEKPLKWAAKMTIGAQDVYLCRCPYCAEVFQRNPDFYVQRFAGIIPNEGVRDHEGCCVRPA